jgi:hypothetical protein
MSHQTLEHTAPRLRSTLALILGGSLFLSSLQSGCATQPSDPYLAPPESAVDTAPAPDAGASQATPLTEAPESTEQLDQLVAPIALYPDALVAQVLAAATYPAEVVEAERFLQAHPELKDDSLAKAVDTQSWDDSVKALVQFPAVLSMLDKNLSWTSSLGEAYTSDSQGVMNAIQQMRARAQQAGNLKSTPQQNVSTQGQTIVIEPAEPETVYVPEYDPWLVYGAPLPFYPDWYGVPGLFIGGPGIAFGFGFGIGLFGGFGWGWHHWGADWHGHGIVYNHAPYVSHSPAFFHHGPGRPGGFARGPGGFRPGGFHPGGVPRGGARPGAFSGFNHGGAVGAFSARGRASVGGFHGGGFHGGFHGGGHR